MFSPVELHTSALDQGVSFSPLHTVLLLLMLLAIPLIPYAVFYLALVKDKAGEPLSHRFTHAFRRMFAWGHIHHHPQLLHH